MNKGLRMTIMVVSVVYIPLLLALFLGGHGPILVGHRAAIVLGLLAYSLMVVEILLSERPKVFERAAGLHTLYVIHGAIALVVLLTAIAHIGTEIIKSTEEVFPLPTVPLGFLGFLGVIIATMTGVLHLSVTFISRSPTLIHRKNHSHNRERALWLHRLSLLSTLLLFGHIISIPTIRENQAFTILLSSYVGLAIAFYGGTKLKNRKVTHTLNSIEAVTEGVYRMEFVPIDGKSFTYRAGQYVFVCFTNSALPRERHPFSIVSAPVADDGSLTILSKQLGDFTQKLNLLKAGDTAAIEGPYGHFWDHGVAQAKNPLVLMAGGIGITPLSSILEEQLAADPTRSIHLVWGVATLQDAFYVERLQRVQNDHPHFHFSLILSKEEHSSHAHGRIDSPFLERIGVKSLYPTADFFICGPSAMMDAVASILTTGGVAPSRIHLERFSF